VKRRSGGLSGQVRPFTPAGRRCDVSPGGHGDGPSWTCSRPP